MKLTPLLLATAIAAVTVPVQGNNTTATNTRNLNTALPAFQMCGVDIHEHNIQEFRATYKECFEKCLKATTAECGGVAWNTYLGGTCWFKGTGAQYAELRAKEGVDSVFKKAGETGNWIWSTVRAGWSMPIGAHNIAKMTKPNVAECQKECVANNNCFAITYLGGTCFIKDRGSTYISDSGASSAILARKVGPTGRACPGRPFTP